MRAVQFRAYGPPDVLELVEVDPPRPGPGTVRVAVRASSLAPGEMTIRSGVRREVLPARFPYRTGFDAAGVVDELGEGVEGVRAGEEVFGYVAPEARGANADLAVLVAWAPKPKRWSWAEAGAIAGSAETATRVLDRLAVGPGETLLVHGASGAVGTVAVQLAVASGARVIGTAGERNQALVRALGAAPTTYGPGLADRVRSLAPDGVDAVFDAAGGTLPELVGLAGGPSRVVTIADVSAPRLGVHLSHGAPREQAEALGVPSDALAVHGLRRAAELGAAGRLRPLVASAYPLTEVVAAVNALEAPHAPGKVVLLH